MYVFAQWETKYNWLPLGVISSGTWCPVALHCDRAFSLCQELYDQLLSVKYIALLRYVVPVPLDNECCVISVAVDYRVLPETIAYTVCITQQCHTLT